MNFVYFPVTYISNSSVRLINLVFKKISMYSITGKKNLGGMQGYIDKNQLDMIVLDDFDWRSLDVSLEEYKNWWSINQGGDTTLKNITMNDIPFYNENSIFKIKTDIQDRKQNEKKKVDPFLESMFFLRVAHEFDIQKDIISNKLNAVDILEKNLYNELKGENSYTDNSFIINSNKKNELDRMIAERVRTWSLLFLHNIKNQSLLSGIYVTDSSQVINYIVDKQPSMELIFSMPSVRVADIEWEMDKNKTDKNKTVISQEQLSDCLEKLAKNDNLFIDSIINKWKNKRYLLDKSDIDNNISISIYIEREVTPVVFFKRFLNQFLNQDDFSIDAFTEQNDVKNTILVSVSID